MRHLLCLAVSGFLFSLIACGGGSSSTEPEPNPEPILGGLTITVSGLPAATDANINVTGPNNFSQTITQTTTLSNLVAGSYTLENASIAVNGDTYIAAPGSQTVTVVDNQTATASVIYELVVQQASVFPTGLALASPTEIVNNPVARSLKPMFAPAVMTWTTAYADAVSRINQLLNGEIALNDAFTPELFFNNGVNADCYGPSLLYEDHPDAAAPNSGQLPGGDLMMWLETDVSSGHTCSAAELNARLRGIKNQSFASLMSLASMLYVANANGYSMPAVGDSLDLTTEMNALGLTGVTFTVALLEQVTADHWKYTQNYSYDDGGATPRDISVTLSHTTGASDVEYDGLLAYTINGDDTIFGGGNCSASERTLNGSLAYLRESDSQLKMQSRVAIFCGADAAGFVSDSTAADFGQVDPADSYDPIDNPDGWSENFNLFGMEMDPNTLEGSYAYVWQAGLGDSHSRIFLMGVNYNETGGTSIIDGEAYAGFGDTIMTTDGMINGMICNWAGPNNSHTLQPYSQRQFFSLDESTGIFNTPAGGSDVTYAPTNSCAYDGLGSFIYDTNLNNDLSDETASGAIAADLFSAADTDSDGIATMSEAIANRGYTLPDIPGGFPAL